MSESYKPSTPPGGMSGQTFSLKTIYDYVMETPSNTNPNVLKSLLEKLQEGVSINESAANALLVPIANTNGTLTSPITYDQLVKASIQNIPIWFVQSGRFTRAEKDNPRDSFSSTFSGVITTFNSDNTITQVETGVS